MLHNPKPILVVDDDDAIRTLVERVLRRERYEVETARDGEEAIEKLSSTEYGIVLLDLMMPRIDGYGVLRFLEQTSHLPTPRVILMTASPHGAVDSKKASRIYRIVAKPFDIHELLTHVHACCSDRGSGSAELSVRNSGRSPHVSR